MVMQVVAVPAFDDNYIWLVHEEDSGETAVVDPGDGAAALAEAQRRGWTISQIWNTHRHGDHVGGNLAVKAATGAAISGPAMETIPGIDRQLREGDTLRIGNSSGRVIEVPGHTLGHIALVFDADGIAFVGDTLFAMGCGRLFEGTPAQMFDSLQKLVALAPDTALYCAHEYTLSNALFAAFVEPDNRAIADRLKQVQHLRAAGTITLPTTVAQELATNPFVRARDAHHFAALRAQKDSFRLSAAHFL